MVAQPWFERRTLWCASWVFGDRLAPQQGKLEDRKYMQEPPNTSKFDLRRLTCDVWICAANMIITTTTMLLRLYRHTRSTCCHSICS